MTQKRIRPPIPEEAIDAASEERAFREEIAYLYGRGSDFLKPHPPTKESARVELAIEPAPKDELLATAERFQPTSRLQRPQRR